MKEHPILFSTPMVQAILDGRKTQTRRLAKVQGPDDRPPWQAGDRLWVRETYYRDFDFFKNEVRYFYRANELRYSCRPGFKWTPSIHMPREACRLVLEIDGLRLHQLKEVTEEEARAEGCDSLKAFHLLWNKTYPQLGKDWDANPWVWAIKFHIAE